MALQTIGLGTSPNDGTGDSIRVAGDKINDNFVELYNLLGDGTTLGDATFTTLTSTGNVGIGTSSPGQKLTIQDGLIQIQSSSTDTRIVFTRSDTNSTTWMGIPSWDTDGLYIYGPTASSSEVAAKYTAATWELYTAGTERMQIDSSGNITLNSSSTNVTTVNGRLQVIAGATSSPGIRGAGDPDTGITIGGAANEMGFVTGGSERARIDSSGNVGIGTSSPDAKLEVAGDILINNGAADGSGIRLASAGYSEWYWDNYFGNLRAISGVSERMRITSSGNVGIGTSSPDGTLHVHTDSSGTVTANSIADDLVVEGGGNSGISILTPNTSIGSLFFGDPDNNNVGRIQYYHATNFMAFNVSASEAMRIDSSGNLLVGATTAGASKLVVADDSIQVNTAKTPASASATGTTGQIAWDASYIYVCTATNTWRRVAHGTW
jgi:hypothetical protein